MSLVQARKCRHCDHEFYSNDTDAIDSEHFCSEDCENEYEPDTCPECYEELDPDWEHECPMVVCEANPEHGEYNENQEPDGCPVCYDESD
jgi:hypothetical protein